MDDRDVDDERTLFHCPRCGRENALCGEAILPDGTPAPVFQCDDCVVPWRFGRSTFDVAYTYAVGPDGRPIDALDLP